MKKLLKVLLTAALVLTFTLSAFAETFIHYTFTDPTGTVYHFGSFENSDTDAGMIIGEKEYSLKNPSVNNFSATAFDLAKEKGNKFGIGFKTAEGFEGESYQVIPYAKDADNNVKKGQAITVNKNAYVSHVVDAEAYAITDDLHNNFGELLTSEKNLVIRTDGLSGPVNRGNQQTAVLKIDLTEFSDAIPGSNYILNLKGKVSPYSSDLSEGFDSVKVKACYTAQDWQEDDLSAFTSESLLIQISNKNFAVDATEIQQSSEEGWYRLNLTSLIQKELAEGAESVSVGLWCDNSEAEKLSSEDGMRNALKFTFSSKDGENPPFIEYQRVDPEYTSTALKTLSVNGKNFDAAGFDENNQIACLLSYGEAIESIVATSNKYAAVGDAVKVDDDTYTVTVTSGSGETETYTLNFKWERESELTSLELVIDSADTDEAVLNTFTGGQNTGEANKYTNYFTFTSNSSSVAGYNFIPCAGAFQLDLSKLDLENLDVTKDITLSLDMGINDWDNGSVTNVYNVGLYDLGTVDYTAENLYAEMKNVSGIMAEDNLIAVQEVYNYNNDASNKKQYTFDITDFVIECIKNGNLTPSVAVCADYTPYDATKSHRIMGYVYFNYWDTGISGSRKSEISYYKCKEVDPSYYSADIETLTVNGRKIDVNGFDENNQITCLLSYGEAIESIVATANEYATVGEEVKVDDDTYTVTITSGSGEVKTYTVNIEWAASASTLTSAGFNVANGVYKNSWSVKYNASDLTTGQGGSNSQIHAYGTKEDVPVTVSGTTYTPSIALIELDLSKLTNLDTTKKTELFLYGSIGPVGSAGKMIVSFYDVTDRDISSLTADDLRDISQWKQQDKLLDETVVENAAVYGTNGYSTDISGIIAKYYGTGVNPIVALYVTPGAENSDARVRIQATTQYSGHTSVKYYKFDN